MIIDGNQIKEVKKKEIVSELQKINKTLKLVVIQVGNNSSSDIYIRNKKRLCEEVGILCDHLKYDSISEDKLISKIDDLNNDSSVTGIIVQLPLPDNMDEEKIVNAISPFKDVDGLTTYSVGKLFSFKDGLYPCTALGIMDILDSININLEGANVVIVGRSSLVGKPLMGLMLKSNATVTVCHSKTVNLKEYTKRADVLIVAVGKPCFITEDYVKDDAVVIDVGINRVDGKIYGDCDFDSISKKAKAITPVPGGVGPLTVVYLICNVVKAYYLQQEMK